MRVSTLLQIFILTDFAVSTFRPMGGSHSSPHRGGERGGNSDCGGADGRREGRKGEMINIRDRREKGHNERRDRGSKETFFVAPRPIPIPVLVPRPHEALVKFKPRPGHINQGQVNQPVITPIPRPVVVPSTRPIEVKQPVLVNNNQSVEITGSQEIGSAGSTAGQSITTTTSSSVDGTGSSNISVTSTPSQPEGELPPINQEADANEQVESEPSDPEVGSANDDQEPNPVGSTA